MQELLRVLFSALEKHLSSACLTGLYEGAYSDYVHCRECDYRKEKQDTFMDLSLDITGLIFFCYVCTRNTKPPDTQTKKNRINYKRTNKQTNNRQQRLFDGGGGAGQVRRAGGAG